MGYQSEAKYLIEEFWIINWDGVPLFSFSHYEKLNPALLGGFFSAIQEFAKELSYKNKSEYISSISFGNYKFNFLINSIYQLYFISKSSKKISEKTIRKHLKNVEKMFINEFREDLINFEGEVTNFEKFRVIFKKYFQTNFSVLKGIW